MKLWLWDMESQKKVNMTGAVSSVDMSKMVDSRPITSLSAGLSGMAAGVSVTTRQWRAAWQ